MKNLSLKVNVVFWTSETSYPQTYFGDTNVIVQTVALNRIKLSKYTPT